MAEIPHDNGVCIYQYNGVEICHVPGIQLEPILAKAWDTGVLVLNVGHLSVLCKLCDGGNFLF